MMMTTTTMYVWNSVSMMMMMTMMACLWTVPSVTEAFNVTFEEETMSEWQSPKQRPFLWVSGQEGFYDDRLPMQDATLGTMYGKYAVAVCDSNNTDSRLLYSACLMPTGPRCTLHFDTWLSPSRRAKELLHIMTMTFCSVCSSGPDAKAANDLPYIVSNDPLEVDYVYVPPGRWVHHRVELGAVHSMFVMVLLAYVPDNDSALAIDGIYLQDCQMDLETEVCAQEEFQCPHSSQCIPRAKLCDLQDDCYCAEDESLAQCEDLPSEAKAEFKDCDFDSGQCYWYDVPSPHKDTLPWKIVSAHNVDESRVQPRSSNFSGNYAYVTALTAQSQWTSDLLRSVDFPALPYADGACAVRFMYWVSGFAQLTLQIQELGGQAVRTLWQSQGLAIVSEWVQASVFINKEPVPNRYVIQVWASDIGKGYSKSAVAVANITLSPDCFLPRQGDEMVVQFTPCGAEGPEGPTPEECEHHYSPTSSSSSSPPDKVTVLTTPPFTGTQLWTVPASGKYNLQAHGARGGRDKEGTDSHLTYGAHVQAKFRLDEGDTLAVIVGQKGQDSLQMNTSSDNLTVSSIPSGGGGGGATFVFKWSEDQEPQLLIMAGGGGGLDYVSFAQNGSESEAIWQRQNAETLTWTQPSSEGNFSGRPCPQADSPVLATGGYGAGFGACRGEGGHGGGVDVSSANGSVQFAGLPGAVYIHPDNIYASFNYRSHPDHGLVEIRGVSLKCPCDYLCLWKRPELLLVHVEDEVQAVLQQEEVFSCICRVGSKLAEDGLSCEAPVDLPDAEVAIPDSITGEHIRQEQRAGQSMPVETAVTVSVTVIIGLIVLVVIFFVYVMRSSPQDRLWSLRQVLTRCLRNRSQSLPLHTLPASALPARVLHINPNYSFINSKVSDTKLPEIPRDNLRMAAQLGHGAFGEVYKGFLSGMSGTEREVAVAVKTLPPLCSEQTELDFYMEAFIISKFHHPNIVHFLGVCFEQHPRYIVLELLEGGNLKSFLRENRPSEGHLSKLSVGDLISLTRDVCNGCCYLEDQHFIHRDIAARNCLLTSKGSDRVAKIADFGMSRDVYRADYYKKEGRALLPLKWMPPEAFMEGMFTAKTDVWSFGIVLWEIFAMGYMPYPALSNTEVMNFIYIGGRLNCPEGCPSAVYELMLSCWKHKSEERPTFHSIKLTLDSIVQDTATMSQHIPTFRLPHLQNGCSGGRNLMLLNHPVPALGLHFQQDPSPTSTVVSSEPSCTEPLLKSKYSLGSQPGARGGSDSFAKKCATTMPCLESDSSSSKDSCSSLEPLLPPDTQSASDSEGEGERVLGLCGGGLGSGELSPEGETNVLTEKERRAGQRVKLPPLGHRCDNSRLLSASSLSTLEETDELLCDEGKNATV